ncbi:diguanylate cyclase [Atrimonas thermophila]|uniref:diguanylate cyclase n=1 Tax=Atrimonas thermophila TaxID=3064161 RepID=UPI00399CD4DC
MKNGNQGEIWIFVHTREETFERLAGSTRADGSFLRDPLTHLFSRLYFEVELERLDTERQLPLSIVMADLNYLKLINDAFGHREGDFFLVQAAEGLRKICRREDIVARIGGDEFAILLPRTNREQAEALMERLSVHHPPANSKCPIPMSLAWGIATKSHPQQSVEEILRRAEQEMYHQKTLKKRKLEKEILELIKKCLEEKLYPVEPRLPVFRRISLGLSLATAMGLSSESKELFVKLLVFHDLGKLSISPEILKKPASELDPGEWQTIREHPERGYRIASQLLELAPIGEAILSFRERWDGKGYPQGLKREEIPLLSRMGSVINAYEAMVMGRPYRPPLISERALEEIQKHAGVAFDPQVVSKFTEAMRLEASGNCPVL